MRCQELREMFDSYLGDELSVETNHEVLRHLENCAACRGELAARRELRARVSSAVISSPERRINPVFAARLQSNLREAALRPNAWEKLKRAEFFNPKSFGLAAAALLILALAGAIWLGLSPLQENRIAENNQSSLQPDDSSISQAVRAAWQKLTGEAVGDHLNCALDFRLAEEPISLNEAAEKYGKFNRDLDKTVIAALDGIFPAKQTGEAVDKVAFYEAHSCVYQGRRFAHVILLYRNRRVSVLVTEEANLSNEADEEIRSETSDGGMIAARFRAAKHIVFVVSDLTATENVTIAQKLSPAIRRHIEQAEAGA